MKKILVFMGVALVATGVMAGSKPIQLSLTPDIAIFDRSERIEGLTIGIWSENPQAALALGVVIPFLVCDCTMMTGCDMKGACLNEFISTDRIWPRLS